MKHATPITALVLATALLCGTAHAQNGTSGNNAQSPQAATQKLAPTPVSGSRQTPTLANRRTPAGTHALSSQAGQPTQVFQTSWSVGPSYEDLVDKLRDLRERKKYDWEHGRRYQAPLAERIEIVKRALRNHHGAAGLRAARNEPGDTNPPR